MLGRAANTDFALTTLFCVVMSGLTDAAGLFNEFNPLEIDAMGFVSVRLSENRLTDFLGLLLLQDEENLLEDWLILSRIEESIVHFDRPTVDFDALLRTVDC